jgi:hypothetical protein
MHLHKYSPASAGTGFLPIRQAGPAQPPETSARAVTGRLRACLDNGELAL